MATAPMSTPEATPTGSDIFRAFQFCRRARPGDRINEHIPCEQCSAIAEYGLKERIRAIKEVKTSARYTYYKAAEGLLYWAIDRFLKGDPRARKAAELSKAWCDLTGEHEHVEDVPLPEKGDS